MAYSNAANPVRMSLLLQCTHIALYDLGQVLVLSHSKVHAAQKICCLCAYFDDQRDKFDRISCSNCG